MDLQSPSVLAQLPRPLHASTGKTQIGEVYSLTESKKRKRYEVVAAVDGEAVNIYNVQTPKLVTSYAVPPQSLFSCQPCSIRRKLGESGVKRQTYAAIQRPKQHVKCFTEESAGNGASVPVISSAAYALDDSSSPVAFLGIVGNGPHKDSANDPFDILAIHKDGCVRRLASDLGGQRWSMRHKKLAEISTTHEVNSCFIVEFDEAVKSLFKRRQDLVTLALADSGGLGPEGLSVLLMVSHPSGAELMSLKDVKIQVFSIPAATSSDSIILGEDQRMKFLLNVNMADLNVQQSFDSHSVRWNFHSGSAGLHLSFERGFINLDLSQYAPTVTSQFILNDESFSSILRISPHTVIGAGKTAVSLFDTEHQSVQRSIQLDEMARGQSASPDHSKNLIAFISYYPKLGIAVATKGNTLVAFDLSTLHTSTSSSLKRSRDGLLIDAIGRGVGGRGSKDPKAARSEQLAIFGLSSPEEAEKWNLLRDGLTNASKSQDSEAFDQALVSFFGSTFESQSIPAHGQYVHPEIISFVLSKIFHLSSENTTSSNNLSIALWPQKACTWLVESGHLCVDNVDVALRRAAKPRILPPVPQGSFIQALVDSDPSLKRLNQVLHGPGAIGASGLAHSLKLALNLARSRYTNEGEEPRAITNGVTGDGPSSMITSSSEPSLTDIFTALNISLQRLHHYAVPTIIHSIRSTLSRTEIISMIHHLRICLATGGYTSRFTENPPTPISPDHITPSLPLGTIIDLMTACVDAIGPAGWISAAGYTATGAGNTVDAREFDLINDLKSEISAALSGVEEATYLKCILREFLRYGEDVLASAQKATGKKSKSRTKDLSVPMSAALALSTTTAPGAVTATETMPSPSSLVQYEKLNGADLIVFGGGNGDDDLAFGGEASAKLLPLSLKGPSTDVSRTKIKRSTGEVKTRSSREIGYLRRKAAGKYSFERLVI